MYALKPDRIYAHEDLRDNADARIRLARFLTAMGRTEAEVEWFAHADAIRVSRELAGWQPDPANRNGLKLGQPVVFSAARIGAKLADDPVYQARPADQALPMLSEILGYMHEVKLYHAPEVDAESATVCWPAMFLGSVGGCSHGCVYCGNGREGKGLAIALNVREVVEQAFRPAIEQNPQQKCFLMIGQGADMATLEPEYGLFEDFLNLLGEYPDRYGYFHTNGDCVDWVETVSRRDRLIGVWSLCSNEAAEVLEPGAPPASKRIAAMAKLNHWNVPVRVKLKPVLPIRGWQESYARLLEDLLTRVKPETLGFCSLIWTDYERLVSLYPEDSLDPGFVAAAREARVEMAGKRHGPFPHEKRAELYRFLIRTARRLAPKLPLFISTETNRMWDELAAELGQQPHRFLCGCSPIQGPGPRFARSTLRESNYRSNQAAGVTG